MLLLLPSGSWYWRRMWCLSQHQSKERFEQFRQIFKDAFLLWWSRLSIEIPHRSSSMQSKKWIERSWRKQDCDNFIHSMAKSSKVLSNSQDHDRATNEKLPWKLGRKPAEKQLILCVVVQALKGWLWYQITPCIKLKQLSCKAPPGDHLYCCITFIQTFPKLLLSTESDFDNGLRSSHVSEKLHFPHHCEESPFVPFCVNLLVKLFPISRPSPTPPAGPTFYVDLATPDSTVKEAMEGSNVQVQQQWENLLSQYFFWLFLSISKLRLMQPDLLPDEQVICQADRVVTYSTGWDRVKMFKWPLASKSRMGGIPNTWRAKYQ